MASGYALATAEDNQEGPAPSGFSVPLLARPRAIGTFINRTLIVLKSGEANPVSIAYGSPPTDPGGLSILFQYRIAMTSQKSGAEQRKTAPRHI